MKNITTLMILIILSSAAISATYTVNTLADNGTGGCDVTECTLREAIAASSGMGADTIVFDSTLTGTIVLVNQLYIGFNDLQILGPGPEKITVSGNNATRVFRLFGGNIVIKGLTIAYGKVGRASGAGVFISNSNGNGVVLEDLRIIGNVTNFIGAGVYITSSATIRNCEISGNTALVQAGLGINTQAQNVLIENVTISGNTGSQDESGIGVFTTSGENVTIRYMTVANNSGAPVGATFSGSGTTTIEGSIFADNIGTDDFSGSGSGLTINNSIIETTVSTLTGVNNIVGQDPKLSALGSVAGSIQQVHAIANDSIARDHIDVTMGNAQCGTGVTTDQTGFPRPTGASCDAGAFESAYLGDPVFKNGFE